MAAEVVGERRHLPHWKKWEWSHLVGYSSSTLSVLFTKYTNYAFRRFYCFFTVELTFQKLCKEDAMRFTKMENPLFFMKRVLVYTVLGAVLLLSVGLLSIADWADAAGSDRISFASNSTGSFDIYVIDTNGENRRNVTNHPTDEFGPWVPSWVTAHTWSPDGRFLAYVSKQDGDFKIYVMDTRTREHWRLTHRRETEWYPAWSPDGKWIAFVSQKGKQSNDIYKTDINGAHLVKLTAPGGYHGRPAWSPDGKQIASISHHRGEKKPSLYVMGADGKKLKRVLDGGIQAIKGVFRSGCVWSPDGKQIVFSFYVRQDHRDHLCVIDVDGKNFRQLTRGGPIVRAEKAEKQEPLKFPPPPPNSLPEIGFPAWSPDGKWIAYVYSDTVLSQTADIYIIDAKGNGGGTPLVESMGQDLSPAWVPEGFLSVSPSAEKQTTLWGKLKQKAD